MLERLQCLCLHKVVDKKRNFRESSLDSSWKKFRRFDQNPQNPQQLIHVEFNRLKL